MPLLIAHRGLVDGPNSEIENKYETLLSARQQGFDVEIDVWCLDHKLWVGHDKPDYEITTDQLKVLAEDTIDSYCHAWIHCKNIQAVRIFYELSMYRFTFFYHENDAMTLASNGYFWTYPSKQLTPYSICVLPETTYALWEVPSLYCYGFCSDRVNTLKDIFYPTLHSHPNRGW